jgi:membrane protein DedA with SNARE-associated domain
MEDFVQTVIAFIAAHPGWTFLVMFVVSFGESVAIINLFFPGTAILLAAGTLVPSGRVLVWPLLAGAILGALSGDGFSYWIGRRFGGEVERIWPFTRHPELIARGVVLFSRHGGKSVFIGRFFGPVRAIVPLAAGILRMQPGRFWAANISSAVIWAPAIFLPGVAIGDSIGRIGAGERFLPIAVILVIVLVAVAFWLLSIRLWRSR